MVQWKHIQLVTMRLWVQSLTSLSGLRMQRCLELWCRSQTRFRLRSGVAVTVVWPAVVAPIRPLAWEPPYAAGTALKSKKKKKKKKKKKRKKKRNWVQPSHDSNWCPGSIWTALGGLWFLLGVSGPGRVGFGICRDADG